MIAVGGGGNALRAGLMGTEQAGGGAMPMIWAGSAAASSDGIGSAAFRVYNSGHVDMGDVSITSTGSDGRLTLSEGDIMLSKSSGATTSLTSKVMGSLTAAIGKAGGQAIDKSANTVGKTTKLGTTTRVSGTKGGVTIGVYSAGNTEKVTLFTAPYKGKCSITATTSGTSTLSATPTGESSIWVDNTLKASGDNARNFISTKSTQGANSVSILAIYKDGASVSKTQSSGTTSFDIVSGATYSALVQYTNSVTLSADTSWTGTGTITFATNVALTGNLSAGGRLAMHLVSTEYINKYYADGFMLFQNTGGTDSTLRYAGMTSADATVMQMRSGAAVLKFTDKGLMQSLNGGGVFQHLGPLLFHIVYNNSAYTTSCAGKSYTVTRQAAGKFQLMHNLGTTNYMAFAQAVHSSTQSSNWYCFARVVTKASNTLDVWLIDRDGSIRDDDFEIAIFRW